jgi:hypothetical protein
MLKRALPRVSWLCLVALVLLCPVVYGATKEIVSVDGRRVSLPVPPGFCMASGTAWGEQYQEFLTQLGIGAGADPRILLILSDCEFMSGRLGTGAPLSWGYLAYDANLGKFWFGQSSLNKRLKAALRGLDGSVIGNSDVRRLTDNSLAKMKSQLKIGNLLPLGEPVESENGFLASAVTRLENASGHMDVYLVSVTFLKNRQILTLTLYSPATSVADLDEILGSAVYFLEALDI